METLEERRERERRERERRERERRELGQPISPSPIQLQEYTIGGTLDPEVKALEARLAEKYLAK